MKNLIVNYSRSWGKSLEKLFAKALRESPSRESSSRKLFLINNSDCQHICLFHIHPIWVPGMLSEILVLSLRAVKVEVSENTSIYLDKVDVNNCLNQMSPGYTLIDYAQFLNTTPMS